MAGYQEPKVPTFASEMSSDVMQIHSRDYKNPAQLRDGGVLVVGAGNSCAEIALEIVRAGHPTWLAGRSPGEIPFDIERAAARYALTPLLFRVIFHRLLTVDTPMGRKARLKIHGTPLIRTKALALDSAGVQRVPRMAGTRDGKAVLEDGRVLDVPNIVWSTGYEKGLSWIDAPIFSDAGELLHDRGRALNEPGLWFVGVHFLYAMSSAMIHGVGRDAERIATWVAHYQSASSHAGLSETREPAMA